MKLTNILFSSMFLLVSMFGFAQNNASVSLQSQHLMSENEKNTSIEYTRAVTDPPTGEIHAVAEYEPMQGVLVAYPFGIPMELIREMSEDVMVTTIVANSSIENTVRNLYQNAGVNMEHVNFLQKPHNTYWTRDFGPWFIREEEQISIVDIKYNRPRPNDDIMPTNVAEMLDVPVYVSNVVHTGGNYMCDGFAAAAQTELVYEENTMSDAQVDAQMHDYLGIDSNYVITDPLGDYIKHIDCWGKFLAPNKILVARVPQSDPRYNDYEAAANFFASRNCAYGYPYQVFRADVPGNYQVTPYSNSLILNNKVLVPVTGTSYDDAAIAVYQQAMPGYEIIAMQEGSEGWLNTDALHCRTHEIADIGMLRITHIPAFHGVVPKQDTYEITAKIHAYSNEAIIADSTMVYYKINDGAYQTAALTLDADEIYKANISATFGDTVSYYIHSADASGRSENMPYIGAPDPFQFIVNDNEGIKEETLDFEVSAYPNPIKEVANISLALNKMSDVKIEVVNVIGKHIATLTNTKLAAGQHDFVWQVKDKVEQATGVYFVNITVNGQTTTKKLIKY